MKPKQMQYSDQWIFLPQCIAVSLSLSISPKWLSTIIWQSSNPDLTHLLLRPTDSHLDRSGGELDRQLPRRARLPTDAAADGALGLHGLHRHPALLHRLRRRRRAGDQGQDDWRNHSSLQKVDQTALSSQSDGRLLKLLFSDWSRAFAPWVGFQVRVQKHHTDHQSEKFLVPFLAWNFKEVLDCLETLEKKLLVERQCNCCLCCLRWIFVN